MKHISYVILFSLFVISCGGGGSKSSDPATTGGPVATTGGSGVNAPPGQTVELSGDAALKNIEYHPNDQVGISTECSESIGGGITPIFEQNPEDIRATFTLPSVCEFEDLVTVKLNFITGEKQTIIYNSNELTDPGLITFNFSVSFLTPEQIIVRAEDGTEQRYMILMNISSEQDKNLISFGFNTESQDNFYKHEMYNNITASIVEGETNIIYLPDVTHRLTGSITPTINKIGNVYIKEGDIYHDYNTYNGNWYTGLELVVVSDYAKKQKESSISEVSNQWLSSSKLYKIEFKQQDYQSELLTLKMEPVPEDIAMHSDGEAPPAGSTINALSSDFNTINYNGGVPVSYNKDTSSKKIELTYMGNNAYINYLNGEQDDISGGVLESVDISKIKDITIHSTYPQGETIEEVNTVYAFNFIEEEEGVISVRSNDLNEDLVFSDLFITKFGTPLSSYNHKVKLIIEADAIIGGTTSSSTDSALTIDLSQFNNIKLTLENNGSIYGRGGTLDNPTGGNAIFITGISNNHEINISNNLGALIYSGGGRGGDGGTGGDVGYTCVTGTYDETTGLNGACYDSGKCYDTSNGVHLGSEWSFVSYFGGAPTCWYFRDGSMYPGMKATCKRTVTQYGTCYHSGGIGGLGGLGQGYNQSLVLGTSGQVTSGGNGGNGGNGGDWGNPGSSGGNGINGASGASGASAGKSFLISGTSGVIDIRYENVANIKGPKQLLSGGPVITEGIQ